jgi:hypothetical protein
VAREVISLHAAVKELEEEASKPDSVVRRTGEQKAERFTNSGSEHRAGASTTGETRVKIKEPGYDKSQQTRCDPLQR